MTFHPAHGCPAVPATLANAEQAATVTAPAAPLLLPAAGATTSRPHTASLSGVASGDQAPHAGTVLGGLVPAHLLAAAAAEARVALDNGWPNNPGGEA